MASNHQQQSLITRLLCWKSFSGSSTRSSWFGNGLAIVVSCRTPSLHTAFATSLLFIFLSCPWLSLTSTSNSSSQRTAISAPWLTLNEPITSLWANAAAGVAVTALMTSYRGIPRWRSFDMTVSRSCTGPWTLSLYRSVLIVSGQKPSFAQISPTVQLKELEPWAMSKSTPLFRAS